MSDWMIDTIDDELGTRKLHISHSDNETYSLEVIESKYRLTRDPSECKKLSLELKLGWYEGKYGQNFVERSFYLGGRNLHAFQHFIKTSLQPMCGCNGRYCDDKDRRDFELAMEISTVRRLYE